MKYKYTGDQSEITIRGVTFKKGKAVDVDDASLIQKISAIPDFSAVKTNVKNKK